MEIAVLGTGIVGRTLAGRLHELGHHVVLGTRDPASTRARTETDRMGNPPVSAWLAEHPDVDLVRYVAAGAADLVIVATNGEGTLAAVEAVGADPVAGKVLVDVSNPLDFSHGFPPSLFVKDTDSLAERLQRAFPDARVVKTLNTMTAHVMAHPDEVAGGDHSVFLSGDDPAAKQTVTELLRSMGHTDVIDLGDVTTARGPEMYLPLWLRLMGSLGTPNIQVKVVR